MRDKREFFDILGEIDGLDVSQYQRLVGDFDFARYVVRINEVEADPDMGPTLFLVHVPQSVSVFPPHLFNTPVRRTALEDFLTRMVCRKIDELARFDADGIARRRLTIARPGQKILPRLAVQITEEHVEARMYLKIMSHDGNVGGNSLRDIFFEDMPRIVNEALIACNLDAAALNQFVDLMEDVDQVRKVLPTRGWVAFVGEENRPGRLAASDDPDTHARPISIHENLREAVDVPNTPSLHGIGINSGITVVLGDEYSGRNELMRGLAHGIYNHVPGDGREWMITLPDAVYVSADVHRSIQHVDISAFVQRTRNGAQSAQYTSGCADACASQAAATVEALEAGARVLVYDESDSSPSFLSSDSRLPATADGAVIPLSARARQIVDELGVSIIVGGSSSVTEFVPVADTVLRLDDFGISDITAEAKGWAVQPVVAPSEAGPLNELVEKSRWVVPSSIDSSYGPHDVRIASPTTRSLVFGRHEIDLAGIEQLAEIDQTETIGLIIQYAKTRYLDESRPVREILDLVDRDLSTEGLECLTREQDARLARPRRYELAAALNRIPSLRISHVAE